MLVPKKGEENKEPHQVEGDRTQGEIKKEECVKRATANNEYVVVEENYYNSWLYSFNDTQVGDNRDQLG